jgi:hypothetical protein
LRVEAHVAGKLRKARREPARQDLAAAFEHPHARGPEAAVGLLHLVARGARRGNRAAVAAAHDQQVAVEFLRCAVVQPRDQHGGLP